MRIGKQNISIILLLIFVGVISGLRSYYRLPSGDELLYQYVWEKDDPSYMWAPEHRFERKISSFQDVLQTQKIHYIQVNGRAIIHTIEQSFTGHEGLFCIINALFFILFLYLIVNFTSQYKSGYFTWIITACVLLWLFPYKESLWVSINYATNYLWSATLGMLVLYLHEQISEGKKINKLLLVLIGLIFGWSHEGFVVTIGGGLFIFYCFNFKLWKDRVRWLTIPMWFSAIFLIFAPGNFNRYYAAPVSESARIINAITGVFDNFSHLWLMNILLATGLIMVLCGKRQKIVVFVKQNTILFIMLLTGMAFSLIAHTSPYSHTPTELICFLLLLRLLEHLKTPVAWRITISTVLTLCLLIWGVSVARDTRNNFLMQERVRAQYLQSSNGIIEIFPSPTSWITHDFMRTWDRTRTGYNFPKESFGSVYFKGEKDVYPLNSADYKAIHDTTLIFTTENQLWDNVPVYRVPGGEILWIDQTKLNENTQLEATLKPVNWLDEDVPFFVRFKFLLAPNSYPKTEKVSFEKMPLPNSADSIMYVSDKELGLRHIESIHIK